MHTEEKTEEIIEERTEEKTEGKAGQMKPAVTGLLAVFCCVLWGSAFPCIKIGYRLFSIASEDTGSVILFAGLRFVLAGILVIVFGSLMQSCILLPRKAELGKILMLSLLQTSLQYSFFYIGLVHTTGVKSAIIVGSNSLVTILVASLLFHQEKLTLSKTVGCILGFAGVALANLSGNGLDSGFTFLGEGFIFLNVLSYAFSSVMIKRYSQTSDPVLLSGWQFLVGGITLTAVGFLLGGSLAVGSVPAFGMLFYLALLSAVAYSIWGILLKYNPVSRVSIYGFSNPVIGVLLSALLLGEGGQAFSLRNLGALALVSAGIYTVNRFQSEQNLK